MDDFTKKVCFITVPQGICIRDVSETVVGCKLPLHQTIANLQWSHEILLHECKSLLLTCISFSILLFSAESLTSCWVHTKLQRIFTVALSVSLTTTHIIAALCHAMCVTGSPRIGPGLHLITLLLPVLHM